MKKFFLIIISVILLSSLIPLQSVYAPSVTFDSEINLSNNVNDSKSPQIEILGSNVYVIWQDANDIFFKKSTDSGATFPNPSIDIGNAAASIDGNSQIAVSGNNIYTVWRENNDIKFINSTDNGVSFASAEVQLSSSTNSFQSVFPQVDTPGSNTVYTVWRDLSGANDDIVFRKSTDNGLNFASPIILGTTNIIDANNAGIKITSDGTNVYVVWQTSTDILFARSTDGGVSFGAVQDIGDSSGLFQASLPEIVTAGGNVYVVWQQSTNIKFARNTNNGDPANWSAPITIGSTGGSTFGNAPKITTSATGSTVYAVWRDDSTGGGDIIFKKSTDSGATFGFPTTPSNGNLSGNSGTSTSPEIAVSGTNVHVTWDDATPSGSNSDILYVLSTDDGDTFGSSLNVSTDTATSDQPKLAASGASPFIVWKDGSPGEIMFRTGSTSAISVSFDQTQYKLSGTATITVTDSGSSGSIIVNVKSDTTNPTTIPITLTEGPVGTFSGSITFTETGISSGTILKASAGDTITATFGSDSGTASIFPRTIDFNGFTTFNLNSTANVRVIDQNSNLNIGSADTITVNVNSTANPTGIQLVLTETGANTGIFGGTPTDTTKSTLIFAGSLGLVSSTGSVFVNQTHTSGTYNANAIDKILVDFRSNTDLTGINLELTETGNNTKIFTGTLNLSPTTTNNSTGTLRVTGNDLIVATNPGGVNSLLLVTPKSPQNGALQVNTPSDTNIKAIYKDASITITLTDALAPGGGGGGLVRPGLVVNVLAGAVGGGGGGGPPGPTITLRAVALSDSGSEIISMPQEIRDMAINYDPHVPLEPIIDVYEDFDLPLSINGKGFVLGGYENTLVAQTVKRGEPIEFILVFYSKSEVAHTSLNFNLGLSRTIADSDTKVLLYKDKFEIIDPNGNLVSATGTLNNEGDLKRIATFSIILSDSIQWSNSDLVIRSWNDNLNSGDIIVYNAIKIAPSEDELAFEENIPEPEVEQLKSQYIPIWIKNNASWWSQELIEDADFVAGLEYLIQNDIVTIPNSESVINDVNTQQIPSWIKNTAGWWSDNLITEKEFIDGVQWLINNGIIKVIET